MLDFSRRTLGKVIEHDEKRSGELIGTLRTYLENRSSVSLAAQVLGVHVHTVQYRLSRLEELTGLSLRNAEERLTLELALRILDLAGLGHGEPPSSRALWQAAQPRYSAVGQDRHRLSTRGAPE